MLCESIVGDTAGVRQVGKLHVIAKEWKQGFSAVFLILSVEMNFISVKKQIILISYIISSFKFKLEKDR